jgi:hypothetical protein
MQVSRSALCKGFREAPEGRGNQHIIAKHLVVSAIRGNSPGNELDAVVCGHARKQKFEFSLSFLSQFLETFAHQSQFLSSLLDIILI